MSQQRRCEIFKATNGKWYMILGDHEYAYEDHDCTTYGPFESSQAALDELDFHSNPGAYTTDDSGTKEPPK